MKSFALGLALSLPVSLAVAACGGDDEVGPDGGGLDVDAGAPDAGDDCVELVLGQAVPHTDFFGQFLGLAYPVESGLGGAAPDRLLLELYDSTTGGLPPLETGTFELDAPPNDDLATCQHCLWVPVDWDGVSPISDIYYAAEGAITLTEVTDPLFDPIVAGSTTEVVLRQATIDDLGHVTYVDGGGCARVAPLAFDTSPTPGAPCLSAEDCGNPFLEICDPATAQCAEPQCGEFLGCPEESPVCMGQFGDQFFGACYADCDPTAPATCGEGATCLQLAVDPTYGVCRLLGDGEVGEPCEVEDISSSCVEGALCSATTGTCTRACSFFAVEPGCQDGAQCGVLGACEPDAAGVDVGVGEPCGPDATLAQGCAADGEAFRGICFSYDPELVCEEACFDDLGCEPEEFCALRFSSGLGICRPDPVCGDGELGEIDEVCDDGDTESDDGCSGDCQTVEYDVICAGAAALAVDGTAAGDTASEWDGFQVTCQFGIARAAVYRVEPPGPGRLRLWVESPTNHAVSLRADCDDVASELACVEAFGFDPIVVHQVVDASPAALTAIVSAVTVLEEGPFTVHADWVDQACGDGVVAGAEVCDDGDTESDDGCSGDCAEIEYAVYCAAAPELVSGTPYTGDNTGAPALLDSTCSNDLYGSGPDRLHRITAAAAGTLRFQLDEGAENLTLSVFDGCGDFTAGAKLDCSSVYAIEEVEVEVTPGQELTVVVEGFSADDAGPYTLTTELLP